jgi:L,D-peptidoglycan transpeptidase YkuD (ErfK/YbiS/YcfS/YnhG family)
MKIPRGLPGVFFKLRRMRIKNSLKKVIIIIVILAIITLAVIMLVRFIPKPPEEKVTYARIALSEATSNKADTYSKKLYHEAKALYDSAMINWQEENKRFIYFRNYEKVAGFADLSARKAEQAAKISKNNVSDLYVYLKQQIDKLNNIADQIDKKYASYPLSSEVWNRISKGRMLLKESEVAYTKGQYAQAKVKITESELLLTESFEKANAHLREYFNSFPDWKKWSDRTIKESRQNQNYAIIIDKYSRKCLVYLGGIKKYEYHVELGKNWVGDKRVKGDRATPEGMYKVVKKFGSNKTKYHKALLINYPDETDKEEFKNEIARGTLPRNAKIGSLIEIHGDGGRGIDWTEGCISLTNAEMDVVFKVAKEGTPVTIIGSMVNLDQLID